MNKAILIGRLTRDPELRYTPNNNRSVCQFTIAIDRPFTNPTTNKREADFINVVAWDKTGENVGNYMKKGRLIAVEGRIQTRNYDNNEGKKVYVTEVIATNVQFLESKNATPSYNGIDQMPEPPIERTPYDFSGVSETNTQSVVQPTNTVAPQTMNVEPSDDPFERFATETDISDNDLPF